MYDANFMHGYNADFENRRVVPPMLQFVSPEIQAGSLQSIVVLQMLATQ